MFNTIPNVLLLGGNNLNMFLNVLPELVNTVEPGVMTVADYCCSIGLISPDMYNQLL